MSNFNKPFHARMMSNPLIASVVDRHTFEATDSIVMTIDMHDHRSDYRRILAEECCQTEAGAKWRRRVIERMGNETADQIVFEFEQKADADKLRDFLAARRW